MIRALTSAARLPVRQPSSTTTARWVRHTDVEDRSVVERAQRAQVDDLGVDAVGGELLGRVEGLAERAAVGDQRHVGARAADRGPVDVDRAGVVGELALDVVEGAVLEDEHRVGVAQRRPEHAPGVLEGGRGEHRMPGMCAYQPSRLCECWAASWRPAPVVMRITSGTLNWPPDMCRSVAALFTIWSRASRLKLTVMISTIGRMPPSAAPMPGAHERRLRQRGVADPLGPELLEQAQADGEAAAVAADVLAHEEHPLVVAWRAPRAAPRASPPGRWSSCRRPVPRWSA